MKIAQSQTSRMEPFATADGLRWNLTLCVTDALCVTSERIKISCQLIGPEINSLTELDSSA